MSNFNTDTYVAGKVKKIEKMVQRLMIHFELDTPEDGFTQIREPEAPWNKSKDAQEFMENRPLD